jgi:hypothetical protein
LRRLKIDLFKREKERARKKEKKRVRETKKLTEYNLLLAATYP